MKKIYLLILSVFALLSCSDDCDHGFSKDANISDILVGSWYEETKNEEDTYRANGEFTGEWCNNYTSGAGEGFYWINSEKNLLTWNYTNTATGVKAVSDWKLKNVTDMQFTMFNDVGYFTCGKIVETYTLEVGDTQQIQFASTNLYNILGYESKNPNIASVTSDGLITAEGEKGIAYIKVMSDDFNVWAKIVVGETPPPLWYDYATLIGCPYQDMKKALGLSKGAYNQEGDYDVYGYLMEDNHNYIDAVLVYVENMTIVRIKLLLKSGLPHSLISTYLDSKYYLSEIDNSLSNMVYYTTKSTLENSNALIAYKPGMVGEVIYYDAEAYKKPAYEDLWPDYTEGFGLSFSELKNLYGEPYYLTRWSIPDNDIVVFVEFLLDRNKAYAYIIKLKDEVSSRTVSEYLTAKYEYRGRTEDGTLIYTDNDETLQVEYHIQEGWVGYVPID